MVASSGMNVIRSSRPTNARPEPTDMIAVTNGISTGQPRRRVMNSTTAAIVSPMASLRRVSVWEMTVPRYPPKATSASSPAAATAASWICWAVVVAPPSRSSTVTMTRAVVPSSDRSAGSSSGVRTSLTSATAETSAAIVASSACAGGDVRPCSEWTTSGAGWAAAPGNDRLSSVWDWALPVPSRTNASWAGGGSWRSRRLTPPRKTSHSTTTSHPWLTHQRASE